MRAAKRNDKARRPESAGGRTARAGDRVRARARTVPATRRGVSFLDLMAARSAEERVNLLRAGDIPTAVIHEASDVLQMSSTSLASALKIPRSTLHQWTVDRLPLPAAAAEAAMRLAEFAHLAEEAFGDRERGATWLVARNAALAGERPIDLLATSYGGDIVRRALAVIEYGGVA